MTDYAGMTQLNGVPQPLQALKERVIYLARENRSQLLVALQLHPGETQSQMWLEVLRRLDASLPGIDERCGACQRPITPGAKFCPKCGADLSAVAQAADDEVLDAVKQATAAQFEYLGRMEYGNAGLGVFLLRERATGRLTAFRLHQRFNAAGGNQVFDLAGTAVLGGFANELGAGAKAAPPDPKLLQAVQRAVGNDYTVLGELGRVATAPPPAPPPPPAPEPEKPAGPTTQRNPLVLGLAAAGVILIGALGVVWYRRQQPPAPVVVAPPEPPPRDAVDDLADSATVQIGGDLPTNASITVDGEPLTLGIHRVAAGARVFRAEAPGFQPVEETVELAAGGVATWGPRMGRSAPVPTPPPVKPKPKPQVVAVKPTPQPPPPAPPPAPPAVEPKSNCVALFNASQDWNRAFKQCEDEGNAGGVAAQQLVGLMFEKGLGTPVNRPMALEWFRRAAEAGNVKAQYYYGRMLNDGGGGVKRNREAAVTWFGKAAGSGEPDAMAAMGRALWRGEGVNKNKSEGLRWYEQAAAQGVAEAQYQLATFYKDGDTVAKSDSMALSWMEKAARRGHPKAKTEVVKLREEVAKRRGD